MVWRGWCRVRGSVERAIYTCLHTDIYLYIHIQRYIISIIYFYLFFLFYFFQWIRFIFDGCSFVMAHCKDCGTRNAQVSTHVRQIPVSRFHYVDVDDLPFEVVLFRVGLLRKTGLNIFTASVCFSTLPLLSSQAASYTYGQWTAACLTLVKVCRGLIQSDASAA